jgi:enoyl-CoA hydratase/carnithine racemase
MESRPSEASPRHAPGSHDAATDGRSALVDRPRSEVALVTFNRPDSLNDMTGRFVDELSALLRDIAGDGSVRVVILTGGGRGFSSGHGLDDAISARSWTATRAWKLSSRISRRTRS